MAHHGLLTNWEDIGEGIEVSTNLARIPEGPATSRIAIRSKTRKLDAAIVAVEAVRGDINYTEKSAVIYDDTRMLSGVDQHIRIITVNGIPPLATYVSSNGTVATTYSDFRVRVTSITENGETRSTD